MSKFEKVKAGLILENPNLTEKFFFSSFLSGLKEEVKYMVTAQHPNSVNKAYEHAMHYELALESASKKSRVVPRCRLPLYSSVKELSQGDTIIHPTTQPY
jgi:hypothetical protein